MDETIRFLVEGIGIEREALAERLRDAQDYPGFRPLLIKEGLELDSMAYLLAHQAERPELRTFQQPMRYYRHGQLAAHLLGYVGEISQRELDNPRLSDHKPGDIIGKAGIERIHNERVTGEDGFRRALVTSHGQTLEDVGRMPPKSGSELTLTIDLDLQTIADEELGGRAGGVVAIDPRNGEVLVLASGPSFDPNLFASGISSAQWKELVEDPNDPLQNRVVQNTFSPGSIFKVIMALAGLETGVVDSSTSVYCRGAAVIYGRPFRCWRAGGHGHVRLEEAIQHSCNVYFYLMGRKMGIDAIAKYGHMVGLGSKTGVDLPGEVAGIMPSPEWKRETLGQPWYDGETISVSIGQGAVDVTPIQLARAIGIVATGKSPQLHLTRDADLEVPVKLPSSAPQFSAENLAVVRQGMWRSVNDGGTGRGARVPGFSVCGKTGTAQTISREALERLPEEERARFEPNAWFVGFAPKESPEIVVAVIVQGGGSGGSKAAPLAGKIFQKYYDKNRKPEQLLQVAQLNDQ
jgi:penicillin-binding protein 2